VQSQIVDDLPRVAKPNQSQSHKTVTPDQNWQ